MNVKFILRQRLGDLDPLQVCLFALILMMGCKPEEQERQDKYQATINHENGRLVTVKGETFRIIYIGGVRFRFPDTDQFRWVGGHHATQPETDGIDMSLYRFEVQPGNERGAKSYKWFYGNVEKPEPIGVQVRGTKEPIETDSTKVPGLPSYSKLSDYIVHEDLKLGLKLFYPKKFPKYAEHAFPLTPLNHPIYIAYVGTMYINFAPKVKAEVDLKNMGNLSIDPNWKEIYFEVVNTLNKYREDKQ